MCRDSKAVSQRVHPVAQSATELHWYSAS